MLATKTMNPADIRNSRFDLIESDKESWSSRFSLRPVHAHEQWLSTDRMDIWRLLPDWQIIYTAISTVKFTKFLPNISRCEGIVWRRSTEEAASMLSRTRT